ncbi:MAG: hypothetical protein PF637_13270 [Spirochaetes bacterium]|jgi:uncharacterized membrane protein|nr:hypothetical protein [Spirochaetota bacterium]
MIHKNMDAFIITPQLILYFFPVYGFFGWIGEVIYRSVTRRHLTNPGLLTGPVLPLYGTATIVIIYISSLFPVNNPVFDFIFFAIFCSIIEYLAATLAENYFKVRLWEYDDYKFNLKGRICLRFAFYWGLYALLFLYIIHPFTYKLFKTIKNSVPHDKASSITFILIAINSIIIIDFMISAKTMKRFVITLNKFIEDYVSLENEQIQQYFYKMRKPLRSFKAIRKYADYEIRKRLNKNFTEQLNGIKKLMNGKLFSLKASEKEFKEISEEIISNLEYMKLADFLHHDASILDHSLKVAYASYKISKFMGLDYISTTRGALLHDFFLYDWRSLEGRPYKGRWHGFKHPKVALANAEKQFKLNKIEKDIILKHMWPLTIFLPKYRESILVSAVDKYISSIETVKAMKK